MKLEEIQSDVFNIIAGQTDSKKPITRQMHLYIDLGYDSLEMTDLAIRLDARYSQFGYCPDEEIDKLQTAGDVVDSVWKCVDAAQRC